MVYVLIGVILLVIIVPIISVLPSARQKAQMGMRMAARAAGVTVELTSIDDPNPAQDKYISPTGRRVPPVLKVAAYRLQRKRDRDWRQLPEVSWCLYRDLEHSWHWRNKPAPAMNLTLIEWLDRQALHLPEDVEQIEEDRYTITVYWHERVAGSEDAVFDFLKQCAAQPLHRPDTLPTTQ